MILVSLSVSIVIAQPPMPPCWFYGTVTVGGSPAPDNLNVTAVIRGTNLNWTTKTKNGTYGWTQMGSTSFYVDSDNSSTPDKDGGIDGDTIEFYVNGVKTNQTATFESLSLKRVDLAIQSTTDTTPPVIVHEPVTNGTEGQAVLIEAIITDDVAVAEVTLHYRKIGDPTYSTIPMTLCEGCLNVYDGAIPASAVTTAGVEYYISATDGTNTATHPATNPDTSPHVISMIEPNQPPSAVVLNAPSEINENSVKLEWSKSPDEDFARYEIYQSNSSGTYGTSIHSITNKQTTSFTVTELSPDTTYFFTIKVADTGNLFTYSNQAQAKTTAPSTFPWTGLTAIMLLGIGTVIALIIVRKRRKRVSKKQDLQARSQKGAQRSGT